jgi:prevent-host-death family protein
MQDELRNTLQAINRENLAALWKKAKAGDLEDLNDEEKLIARIMVDHDEEFHSEFEAAGKAKQPLLEVEEEVNPFLHVALHTITENQLAARDPIEVFQFYNAMRKKKVSRHDTVHLIGFFLMPLVFHTLQTGSPFDEARYRALLKKMKKRDPWKIPDLLETELDDYLDSGPFGLGDLQTIESRDAKKKLDALIDGVDSGEEPVLIRSRADGEAVLVSLADYQIIRETEALFAKMEAEDSFPETEDGAEILEFPGNKAAEKPASGRRPAPAYKKVLQFKITLKGIRPPIWRRIQVPENYTFWDLHVAIQDVMGWENMHLHHFVIAADNSAREVLIGIPSPETDFVTDGGILPAWGYRVTDYLSLESPKADYLYDFGDDWRHALVFEKILDRQKGLSYPQCIKGKRACPPENCGSIPGYYELVEAMENPGSEVYEETLEWLGEEYDPDLFSADEITFQDPGELLTGDL